MGYGVVFTLLAELREIFGFSESEVGLIAAAGFLSGFVSQITLARYADRGHTKVLVRMGPVVAFVAMIWLVFATSLWAFVAARFVFGLGSGAVQPSVRRIVILRNPDSMGESLGRLTAFDIGGFVLGPLLGVVALQLGGIRAPFVALAVLYAAAIVMTSRMQVDSPAAPRVDSSVRRLLRSRAMQSALGVALAFYLTVGSFEALWALLMDDLGTETWLIGVTLSGFVIPMVLLASLCGRTAQRMGAVRLCRFSIPIAIVAMVLYGVVGEQRDGTTLVWGMVAVSAVVSVHAIADAFTMPALQVAVAEAAPAELAATAQGVLSAFGLLVALVASLGGAVLYDKAGPLVGFGVPAALMLVGFLIGQALDPTRADSSADDPPVAVSQPF
jgi:MFS family permease